MGTETTTSLSAGSRNVPEPPESQLWAIEAETELLAAELALADAELAWSLRPNPMSAACYLESLAAVTDLWESFGEGEAAEGVER